MSREPAQRYGSADELRKALVAWARTVDPARASLVAPPPPHSPSTLPSSSQSSGGDSLNVGATTATWSSNDSGMSELFDTHMRKRRRTRWAVGLGAAVVGALGMVLLIGAFSGTEATTGATSVGSPNDAPAPAKVEPAVPKPEPAAPIDVERIEKDRKALAEKLQREDADETEPTPLVTRPSGRAEPTPVREAPRAATRRRATPAPRPAVEATPPRPEPPKSEPTPKPADRPPVGKVGERPIRTTL
jgi:hypothetical protein